MEGTPKDLRQAVRFMVASTGFTPLAKIEETSYLIMKDYLGQKFQKAMLAAFDKGDYEKELALKELFLEIVK